MFWHGAYIIHASLEIPKVSLAYWCEIFFEVYNYFMFLRCFSKMEHTTPNSSLFVCFVLVNMHTMDILKKIPYELKIH